MSICRIKIEYYDTHTIANCVTWCNRLDTATIMSSARANYQQCRYHTHAQNVNAPGARTRAGESVAGPSRQFPARASPATGRGRCTCFRRIAQTRRPRRIHRLKIYAHQLLNMLHHLYPFIFSFFTAFFGRIFGQIEYLK